MTFASYSQEFLVEGGVLKIAEILPDSVILYMDHDRIARLADTSGKWQVFADRKDSET